MNKPKITVNNFLKLGIVIALVNISIGVTYSLIAGSGFNVEAFNTKLQLSGIANKNKQLTQELKEVTEEIEKSNLNPKQRKKIAEINLELEKASAEIEQVTEEIIEETKELETDERD